MTWRCGSRIPAVRLLRVAFVAVLSLTTACGGRPNSKVAGVQFSPAASATSPVGTPIPAPTVASIPAPEVPKPGKGGEPTPKVWDGAGPEGYPGPDGNNPDFPLRLRLVPLCVHNGEKITATIQSKPNARLAFIASHPDGDPRGNHSVGWLGPTGEYVHSWVIAPDVPSGRGRFMVTTGDKTGDSTATEVFRVEKPGGACR